MKYKNSYNVINPFNNEIIDEVQIHSKSEINNILENSFNYKSELNVNDKIKIFNKSIDSMESNKDDIAKLIVLETGLSIKSGIYEVDRAINCFKYCIKESMKLEDLDLTQEFSNDSSLPELTVHSEPLDLAIGITPFNHPLNLVLHKVGPAIVAGTSIVIKPSEKTPLSAIKLREILINSGLPENHYNIILGSRPKETTDAILSYQKYDLVSFTGGVKVGKYIARKMASSGNELKKYIPELGGNSILVIMGDCDIGVAIQLAMGAFENSGQRCTAVRRILLHKDISNQFVEKFVNVAKNIKFGDPLDNNNDMGTVISSEQADLIYKRVSSAIKDGANLLIGNQNDGAIYPPTILSNVNPKSEVVQKETFGPIVSIIEINNLDEAIKYIKNDRFGLASGIATKSKKNAYKLFDNICVGQFSWNGRPGYRTEDAPFGGFKDSGNGEKEGVVLMTKSLRRIKTFYKH